MADLPQPRAIDRLVDFADGVADRLRVPLSVVSVGWFALTCADYAGFVRLPSFVLIDGMPGLIASGLFNALWWGFLYPRAEARRAERAAQSSSTSSNAHG
ncbi:MULTISPECIES: hypothetical protein [Sphingomonas]|uniref:hypothetical protein n=1 Tax=Sphingomonas TaxID=13687 RepID=UPI00082DCEB0|nr:hypothetical protein [Sphingomonas sp. CCH10-B3]